MLCLPLEEHEVSELLAFLQRSPSQYTSLPLIRQRLSALSDPAEHEHATEQGRATDNPLAVEHGVGAPQTSVSAPWPTPSPSPEAQEVCLLAPHLQFRQV